MLSGLTRLAAALLVVVVLLLPVYRCDCCAGIGCCRMSFQCVEQQMLPDGLIQLKTSIYTLSSMHDS
jgi:hypothetical protein